MNTDDVKAIVKAAKAGDTAKVNELLDADPALVAARTDDELTPLHCAAWKGRRDVVALLLDRGADINAQSVNGHYGGTALHAAAHANERAIVELLLQHGADPNARSVNGRTPLDETGLHNAAAAARILRQHGARSSKLTEN